MAAERPVGGDETGLHPHTYRPLSQAESDAITITNLDVLVGNLQGRVLALQKEVADLRLLVGYDKIALHEEIERLRQALRAQ